MLPMHESMGVNRQPGRKLTGKALPGLQASLRDIDWRLLYWLLHYPLQHVDDLVVGVPRWASRATVYRHVHTLEARGLVESVLPKTPGTGKRLYHLSNLGLHVLAMHLNMPARKLARRWRADEAGLVRLLPRLPTLLVLQEVVNGLVDHAAEAMTTQGRRPRLVRWSWQRDVIHHFQYREQNMRFFADGVLALCIRAQQGESRVLDQWYGVVLLSTELDDERFMRLRLERLLCWRESPERWACYQHMLPVLILARSQRQCDHWQRAIEAAALKLRLDPLAGALTCFPPEESAHINPWLFNWRTLATEVTCHLQEWLRPLPREAFPLSLQLEEVCDAQSPSNAAVDAVSSGATARLSRLIVGGLANRAAHVTQVGLEEQQVIALLGLCLTPCQWNILRLLLAHPLLSDVELAAFLGLQRRSVRCSLYELHQRSCLEPVVTSVGRRWHFCGRGLRLIAAANHMHIRTIAVVPDDETDRGTSTMIERGETWLLQHIQHTAGIYSFFAGLAQAARQQPEQELCWWETGVVCERRYRVGEQWYNLRPDAEASYRVGSQQFSFWLEWDRGTMNVRDLTVKFHAYAHYVASREWARENSQLPRLFSIAPDIAQERRMQQVAQARLAHTPGLVLCSTTEVLLNEYEPLAPIWLQSIPQRSQAMRPGNTMRQRWSNVISGKKGL
jgi:Replication-relaxation